MFTNRQRIERLTVRCPNLMKTKKKLEDEEEETNSNEFKLVVI